MAKNKNLQLLRAELANANKLFDNGEITKSELKDILFDVYFQLQQLKESDKAANEEVLLSFIPVL